MMNRLVCGLCACLFALAGAIPATRAAERAGPVIFVLDASGSMRSRKPPSPGSRADTRFDSAKDKIRALSVEYEARGQGMGLLVFSHRSGNCNDIELTVPPQDGPDRRSRVSQALDGIQPKGFTPLASAIRSAGETLARQPGAERGEVVVVTDGVETCGGDPASTAAMLRQKYGITTHVIGLDIPSSEMSKLQSIAIAGGGNFSTLFTGAGGPEAEANDLLLDPDSIPKEISFGKQRAPASRPIPKPAKPPRATEPPPVAASPLPLL